MKTKSAAYYRKNPLSDTELIVGGLIGLAALGVGGYLIYQHNQASSGPSQASLNAGLPAVNAASGQSTSTTPVATNSSGT